MKKEKRRNGDGDDGGDEGDKGDRRYLVHGGEDGQRMKGRKHR